MHCWVTIVRKYCPNSLMPPKTLKKIVSILIMLLMVSYPILVYTSLQDFSARYFAGLILAISAIRFVVFQEARQKRQWPVLAAVAVFCSIIIFSNSDTLLYYYPVMMSLTLALVFLSSLNSCTSLIEQILRGSGKPPPHYALPYIRRLTFWWGVFMLVNAVIATVTACCTTPSVWALYNGLLSYMAMGIFIVAELIYRPYYKKQHGFVDE